MKFHDAQSRSIKLFSSADFLKRIQLEDPTMIEHLNILKNINKYGYLTDNSQAGLKRKSKEYEIHERAYICGFMLESKAIQFIRDMAMYTDKTAVFIPFCDDNVYVPSKLDTPVTISFTKGVPKIETHLSMVLPYSVWNSFRKDLHINKNEKIVYITCWDSKWNRNASSEKGLFTDVLKILRLE